VLFITRLPGLEDPVRLFRRGLVLLAQREEALGQRWHIPNAETVITRRLVEMVFAQVGRPARIRPAPKIAITLMALFIPPMAEWTRTPRRRGETSTSGWSGPGHPIPGATVFRAVGNILGFVLAGAGGFSLVDVEQGWVFATLALASVIMLSSGIFSSWLLVLQIGVPLTEKS